MGVLLLSLHNTFFADVYDGIAAGMAGTGNQLMVAVGSTDGAAEADTRINEACKINGVLDDRFRRLSPDEDRVNLGGRYFVNEWPKKLQLGLRGRGTRTRC